MLLTRSVSPSNPALTTEDAMSHLRILDYDSNDITYVESLVDAAKEYVETFLRRTLLTSTWELVTDAASEIYLPMGPIQSVTSVTDEDGNAVGHTLKLDKRLKLDTTSGLVKVTYVAGYGATDSFVPEVFKHAIKLMIGHFYENREEVVVGSGLTASQIPLGVERLLNPHRAMEF